MGSSPQGAAACLTTRHGHTNLMTKPAKHQRRGFLYHHSLSIISVVLLALWIILYACANPATHLGSFYGNAIADWSGSVVIILGTKFLLETRSAESRPVRRRLKNHAINFIYRHSLLLFLFVTGLGWAMLFWKMDPQSKWGQVVGNIVSEWLQMAGLVFLTKRLLEKGSKASRK